MIVTAKTLGISIGIFSLFGIMAASLVASRLPISVAGWGVREGILVGFLGAFGVAPEKAFATSVIYGLAELAMTVLALLIGSAVPVLLDFFQHNHHPDTNNTHEWLWQQRLHFQHQINYPLWSRPRLKTACEKIRKASKKDLCTVLKP